MSSPGLISPAWYDSHAFAITHYQQRQRWDDVENLVERVCVLSARWSARPGDRESWINGGANGLGDLALALGRLIAGGHPVTDYALEFQTMDVDGQKGGLPVDPAMFQTDAMGRAAVWASRASVSAVRGDQEMVRTYVDTLLAEADTGGDPYLSFVTAHVALFAKAATVLIAEQTDRRATEDLERQILTQDRPAYWWACETCAAGEVSRPYRATRDDEAAEHVLLYVHPIKRDTRWSS